MKKSVISRILPLLLCAALLLGLFSLAPTTALAAGPAIEVYGYGGGGGGGGGGRPGIGVGGAGGAGGAGGTAAQNGFPGGKGGNGGSFLGGGGGGGVAGENAGGDGAVSNGVVVGGTNGGAGATAGGSSGKGGTGASAPVVQTSSASPDPASITVIAGNGGDGGESGSGASANGGGGGDGGDASLALTAPNVAVTGSVLIRSGDGGAAGVNRGGAGGFGGQAALQCTNTALSAPSIAMEGLSTSILYRVDIDIGTLVVDQDTTLAVSGTDWGDVVITTVDVASGKTLTINNANNGHIHIGTLWSRAAGPMSWKTRAFYTLGG